MEMTPGYGLNLPQLVERVITSGQPNVQPEELKYEYTSLFAAVIIEGRYQLADKLLAAGTKVTDSDLARIFWWNVGPKTVAFFVERGIPLHTVCLESSLRHSHWDTVFALLDTGMSVQTPVYGERDFGRNAPTTTLLHVVAHEGLTSELQQLLKRGAEAEVFDDEGMTPVMKACHFSYWKFMLQLGDPKATDILLKHGANPNVKNEAGETPLLLCVAERIPENKYKLRNEVVQVLLNYGADPNALSPVGTTALMLAARDNDAALIRSLLKAGADRTLRTPDGKTALDVAVKWKSDDAAELLGQA